MSYGVYHTDMIVLAVMPSGDASNIYTLLTRELGIIRAKAQSVRKSTSKLRFGLQYLSLGTVDVIRAKDFWRIVGVSNEGTLLPANIHHKPLHRIVDLLVRIVPHDERNQQLYDVLVDATTLFAKHIHHNQHDAIEILSVARILALCGYWNESLPVYQDVLVTEHHLDTVFASKKDYIANINAAIRHTQL